MAIGEKISEIQRLLIFSENCSHVTVSSKVEEEDQHCPHDIVFLRLRRRNLAARVDEEVLVMPKLIVCGKYLPHDTAPLRGEGKQIIRERRKSEKCSENCSHVTVSLKVEEEDQHCPHGTVSLRLRRRDLAARVEEEASIVPEPDKYLPHDTVPLRLRRWEQIARAEEKSP